jgi:thioredoxin reductase (NADPH)
MPATERLDALILGGGMAGLTAALWLHGYGLSSLILEETPLPGGQLHEIHAPIGDYPLSLGRDGARFASLVLEEARRAELSILVGEPVTRVEARSRSAWRGKERFRARTLLIASGLRRRMLGIPGERELLGRGVSHSANLDREKFAGKPVVVIGGGTAGVEDSLLCAKVGSEVTLLHHSARFRARRDFLERARREPRITIVPNAEASAILGTDHVESVEYRTKGSGLKRVARAEAVFVRIGWEPRTELLRGQLSMDRAGYVKAKPGGFTSVAGVFAAGDVCSPRCPSLANAAGQGAAAALEIARHLGRMPEPRG